MRKTRLTSRWVRCSWASSVSGPRGLLPLERRDAADLSCRISGEDGSGAGSWVAFERALEHSLAKPSEAFGDDSGHAFGSGLGTSIETAVDTHFDHLIRYVLQLIKLRATDSLPKGEARQGEVGGRSRGHATCCARLPASRVGVGGRRRESATRVSNGQCCLLLPSILSSPHLCLSCPSSQSHFRSHSPSL